MENPGEELHHKTSSGEDIYSTEGNMTQEERVRIEDAKKKEWEYAQSLLPNKKPDSTNKEKKYNVIAFPKQKLPEEEKKKAA